ncbi:MAG: glycoside hydrolase family 31 protein [bacterium]|nr:glycoside hydrolase family 31 protein [bacterium]
MASLGGHFVKDASGLKCNVDCIIQGEKYRFMVLSERLIRMEYSPTGVFEDRASQLVVFRNFEKPEFIIKQINDVIQISTKYFVLSYTMNKPFLGKRFNPSEYLSVALVDSDKVWYYTHPEARNFGGTNESLDDYKGNLKLRKGLYSTDGFVLVNDSDTFVLNEDFDFVPRNRHKNLDLYLFMYRRDFGLCLKDYFTLTGYPTMIPRYILGNCWGKNERYDVNGIVDLIDKFKDNNIPLSAILLGDKWHDDISNYDFAKNLYPDSSGFIKYLHDKNIHLGVTMNPELGVNLGDPTYPIVADGLKVNLKKIPLMPFNSKTLGMYFKLYVTNLENLGVDFFYLDYFDKKDLDTTWLLTHYHVAYSTDVYKKRGFILARNSLIAPHRYPVLYSGKTIVSWETLNILPFYNSSASNLGVSWWAHCIGGYYAGTEDSELFTRFVQLATFSPIFFLASDMGKYYKREPWKWNVQRLKIISDYMKMRHMLIPYLYSEGYVYHKTGAPLVQPLYYRYPEIYDEPSYRNQYYFGSQFFIAPITKKKDYVMNRVIQKVFVPKGIWYDFKSGKKYPGGHYYVSFYRDDYYPVFCKAGGIIPLSNNIDSVETPTDLEIQIFPGVSNTYQLYEDDGISNKYESGFYLLTSIEYTYKKDNYTLVVRSIDGKTGVVPDRRNYTFKFRNTKLPSETKVYFNQLPVKFEMYMSKNDLVIKLDSVPSVGVLTVDIKGDNIDIDAVRLINDDIQSIISDLEITTALKEKIDSILFSDMEIAKKRIEIKKLRKEKLDDKFITLFIKLLEYIVKI